MDLNNNEQLMRSMLDNIVDVIITIDEKGIVNSINKAGEKLFGYTSEEVIGKNVKMLMPEPYTSNHDNYLSNYIRTGIAKVIGKGRDNLEGKRKDGTVFPMYLAINEMWFGDKRMFTGIISNITERKKYEEQLKLEKEKAELATKAKSDFLAIMSHEIRTPMNAIIGMAELLEETKLDEQQQNYVNTFRNAGENLLSIINDILDFSKIEAGRLEIERTGFDLKNVMNYVNDVMTFNAAEKELKLIFSVSPGTPTLLIGDPVRLRQVLINLASNAVKFSEFGEVIVSVSLKSQSGENVELIFSVKDTGIGIPKGKQTEIFDSFSQADSSTTRRYGGTGLGLAISKKIVNLAGGTIWVESEFGKGSEFIFTMKFSLDNKTISKEKSAEIVLKNKRVLIVDDNATNRLILQKMLSSNGMDVTECVNGQACLYELKKRQKEDEDYSIILLDMEMAEMDGLETAKAIKTENISEAPIIILSSSDINSLTTTMFKDAGIAHYLYKPIKQLELISTIRNSLRSAEEKQTKLKSSFSVEQTDLDLKILLAEDNHDNQQLVIAYLKNTLCEIDVAENGLIAVEKFKKNSYDLVLMDVEMPVMDGYVATKEIRKLEQERGSKPIPIIALTAHALKEHRQKSIEAGCNSHLTKPIKKSTLIEAIIKYPRPAQ